MKKLISSTLILTLLAGITTGCTNTPTSTTNTTTSTNNTTSASQEINESNSSNSTIENTNINETNETNNTQEIELISYSEDTAFSNRDFEIGYDETEAVSITLMGNTIEATHSSVLISGNVATITKEGSYVISGDLDNGQIIIDSSNTEKIQLILDNINISNENSAGIFIKQADKVFVTMKSGSTNYLDCTITDEDVDSAIYSKDDLTINGDGTLNINSVNGKGISSNDDLVITNGNFIVNSTGHAFDANDTLNIATGVFDIVSGKDGFHCENKDDLTLGNIYIRGGEFTIDALGDGFDANGFIEILDGSFDIITDGGSANAQMKVNIGGGAGGGGGNMMNMGNQSSQRTQMTQGQIPNDIEIPEGQMAMMGQGGQMAQGQMPFDGEIPEGQMPFDGEIPEGQMAMIGQGGQMGQGQIPFDGEIPEGQIPFDGEIPEGQIPFDREIPEGEFAAIREDNRSQMQFTPVTDETEEDSDLPSAKAIKANTNLTISAGLFNLDSRDDAIHSNNDITILGGIFNIKTGDDAIRAEVKNEIYGGVIDISYCYEGIEGQKIDIYGGDITIIANDDGINATQSTVYTSDREIYINFHGGKLFIDGYLASDGFDSNGNITVSGGEILISGTTVYTDTVLDFASNGVITGGSFIATGSSSHTTQNFGTNSTQASILVILSNVQTGDVTLTDSSNNVLVNITPLKEYQTVTISTEDIKVGETYTLVAGDEIHEIYMESLIYSLGTQNSRSGGNNRR